MRSTNPVTVSVLSLALALVSAISASAQAGFRNGGVAPRGVPASVTSFGFGGRPGFHGVPPSVTSLGFGANRVIPPRTPLGFGAPLRLHNRPFVFPNRRRFIGRSPFLGVVAVPYAYPFPAYMGDNAPEYMDDPPSPDAQSQRDEAARQRLEEDYRAQLNSRDQQAQPSEPVRAQPSTVLIFKDGHQIEVGNYAIVGTTLYDLSGGHSRKVELADLDLEATLKENDQRGVEFQLPAGTNLD